MKTLSIRILKDHWVCSINRANVQLIIYIIAYSNSLFSDRVILFNISRNNMFSI